jgi:PqqD family protein of HPr-rel-A system
MNDVLGRPRVRAGVSVVDVDGEAIVYDIASGGQIHYLNHSAALILDLCDGTATTAEMARAIADVYEQPAAEVEKQVRETVANLQAVGVLATERGAPQAPDDGLDERRLVRMEVPRTS